MNIALIGGTHGNEPVGIEVMRLFEKSQKSYKNSYTCFWGNPKAFELKKRYVDCDLNRAFGKNGVRKGYEKLRAEELESQIKGIFDFSIDLHTTTSAMGLTAILNNTHLESQKAATYLQNEFDDFKLIEEDRLDADSPHLNRLCPAGLTIEVGPVANNVVHAQLVMDSFHIVEKLLDFDFNQSIETSRAPVFKMIGVVRYPDEGWYVHPKLEGRDFKELHKNSPCFVNIHNEVLSLNEVYAKAHDLNSRDVVYPFFVNEAAYLEHQSAFLLAEKRLGF
jgi:aspartoacylase